MRNAIQWAETEGFKALLLDQLYLCARFGIHTIRCDDLRSLFDWAISTYERLGNSRRGNALKTFMDV